MNAELFAHARFDLIFESGDTHNEPSAADLLRKMQELAANDAVPEEQAA